MGRGADLLFSKVDFSIVKPIASPLSSMSALAVRLGCRRPSRPRRPSGVRLRARFRQSPRRRRRAPTVRRRPTYPRRPTPQNYGALGPRLPCDSPTASSPTRRRAEYLLSNWWPRSGWIRIGPSPSLCTVCLRSCVIHYSRDRSSTSCTRWWLLLICWGYDFRQLAEHAERPLPLEVRAPEPAHLETIASMSEPKLISDDEEGFDNDPFYWLVLLIQETINKDVLCRRKTFC